MIRFKVIKASKLLFLFSIVVLIAAVCMILFLSNGASNKSKPAAALVQAETAKTQMVFAVSGEADKKQLPEKNITNMTIEILSDTENINECTSFPKILIYHTHTHEAYEQNESEPYEAVAAWRTKDADQSVVRIGAELAEKLRKKGFNVVHDVTDHELDDLSTAYERSLATLKGYEEPFDLYIDLHRDAYSEGLQMGYIADSGETAAQIMLLVGKGNGFEEKPYYSENYIFAQKLTQRINDVCPGICREVLVKDGRYNQHIGIFSILVEIGHNRNTLTEALNAVSPLAEGIYDLFVCQPDILIEGIMKDRAF